MPTVEVVRMVPALAMPAAATELSQPDTVVADLLDILRRQLRMDLAALARIDDEHLVLQVLRGDVDGFGFCAGATISRQESLLGLVLAGELPETVEDTLADPCLAGNCDVRERGIGSYTAVPIVDSEGRVYGILCCVGHRARPGSPERDGRFLRLLAAFLSDAVLDLHEMWERRRQIWQEVSDLIDSGGPQIIFQPIFRLEDQHIIGVEALSRFPDLVGGAQRWYADAATVGLSTELERLAIERALAVLPVLPPDLTLAVNASPSTIAAGLLDLLPASVAGRLVVEITEHEHIGTDRHLLLAVEVLRSRGVRIAIDDIGTGYAGLEQLLHLRPDIIKLDGVITRGIDTDAARRAIASGLVEVASEIGGTVVAEGIETPAELATAMGAGIPYGQGYLLGQPSPPSEAAWLRPDTRRSGAWPRNVRPEPSKPAGPGPRGRPLDGKPAPAPDTGAPSSRRARGGTAAARGGSPPTEDRTPPDRTAAPHW
ncbi:EAL domain-containing protein [Frankia sp. QA3]|uniref:sensor domain-containing phosphodiesterase n=1 Tax=Frankia sp. QA3 TaxID=710111 RepID=UPI001E43A471|nr:EAL domain-containing protein [Frankia sp. QA3]